jgi:hypothetical protein
MGMIRRILLAHRELAILRRDVTRLRAERDEARAQRDRAIDEATREHRRRDAAHADLANLRHVLAVKTGATTPEGWTLDGETYVRRYEQGTIEVWPVRTGWQWSAYRPLESIGGVCPTKLDAMRRAEEAAAVLELGEGR